MQLKKYQDDLLEEFEKFLDGCRVEDSPAKAFANSTKEWLGFAAPYRPLPTIASNPLAEATPFVCLRVPTGGGKTFLAAHAIQRVSRSYLPSELRTDALARADRGHPQPNPAGPKRPRIGHQPIDSS